MRALASFILQASRLEQEVEAAALQLEEQLMQQEAPAGGCAIMDFHG